jgi:ABC-type branched-subunit amino acid transport system ATPase component
MTQALEVQRVTRSFGGVRALDNFSCVLGHGEILGLIGPNGAGKTTLFNAISGFASPDSGAIQCHGHEIARMAPHDIAACGIARTFQGLRLIRQVSVIDNILLCMGKMIGESLQSIVFRWGACQKQERAKQARAAEVLRKVGLEDKSEEAAENLSYGQQKLLTVACCTASDAKVLLLDEPVAGIAPPMIEQVLALMEGMRSEGRSIMFVEHNIAAIMQICDRVIFMDAGAMVCEGTPERVRNDPRVIEAYLGR